MAEELFFMGRKTEIGRIANYIVNTGSNVNALLLQ